MNGPDNRALRVVMLLQNSRYPQDVRVRQEATALTRAGHRVVVLCPRGKDQRWREVINGVDVWRFPAPRDGVGLLGYAWEYLYSTAAAFLLSLIRAVREGVDVVHAHNPPDTLCFIGAFYKLFGKRFVFDHHDLSPEIYEVRFNGKGNVLVHKVLISLERLSCKLADRVIATNESYKRMDVARAAIPEDRITIVRNGPELELFHAGQRPVELPGHDGKTVICYVGAIGTQDGVEILILALHRLLKDLGRGDFVCVIVGSGDAWARAKKLSTELGLDRHVVFTGRLPYTDVPRYLAAADICVDPDPSNPLNDRSTMIKMGEYMALGKPIVAFDLPEHRVTAGDAACYAKPNDDMAFAELLQALMDDPERRRQMGAAGRRRIEDELAWSHQERHLLAVYRALAR